MIRVFLAATLFLTAASDSSPVQAESTLKIVLGSDLASLDPVQSTAAFVRNHGFLVYDQLFALDSKGDPQPEMVEQFTKSEDGLAWRFTLRPGQTFHDGTPVRAVDAVASIKRWGTRDVVGKALMAATESLNLVDDRTFSLILSRPFALVTEALARPTANALFVMPERLANTPSNIAITDATGSGPYVFVPGEWQVGHIAVYRRNPNYIPRAEPPDGLAGGKVAKLDRIEWLTIPDASTAAAAMQAGEIDFLEQPNPDLIPTFEKTPSVKMMALNPIGFDILLRPNSAIPPFDKPAAREALLYLTDQHEVLEGIGIRASEQVPYCPAYFMCGSQLETAAGAAGLRGIDLPKAKSLLAQAGAQGARVVFMDPADQPVNHAATLVIAENLKRAGLDVDVPAMDWSTLTQRRNKKNTLDQGGWNLFITIASVLDVSNPLTNLYLAAPCENGIAGWPCDEKLEALRRAWFEEPDPSKRHELLNAVQARAYEIVPYVNAGQFQTLAAYRANIHGLRSTTVPVFWGVTKD